MEKTSSTTEDNCIGSAADAVDDSGFLLNSLITSRSFIFFVTFAASASLLDASPPDRV